MGNAISPPPPARGPEKPASIDVGSVVDGWRLESILGRGGMGVVFRAVHESTGISAALKLFQPSGSEGQQALGRFRREVLALARLEHPLVVRILQEALDHEPPYFCMELLPGGSLAQRLEASAGAGGGLPAALLTRLTLELAEGLEAVHGERVLHRDIKPQNVLFTIEGQAKLADFGIAKAQDLTGLTMVGQVMGTFAYMAPESLCGRPGDERTDLYQLGVTLFEAATGRKPFSSGQLMAVMAARRLPLLSKLAPMTSQMVPWLQPVLDRLTATAPEARFQSASELLAAVRREAERFPLPGSGAQFASASPERPPADAATGQTVLASAQTLVTASHCVAPASEALRRPEQAQHPPGPSPGDRQSRRKAGTGNGIPEDRPDERQVSCEIPSQSPFSASRLATLPGPCPSLPAGTPAVRRPLDALLAVPMPLRAAAVFCAALLVLATVWRFAAPARPARPKAGREPAGISWVSCGSNRARLWLSSPAKAGSRVEWQQGEQTRQQEVRAGDSLVTLEGLEPGLTCSGELQLGSARLSFSAPAAGAGEFPDSVVVSSSTFPSASIRLWAGTDHVRLLWARARAGGDCSVLLAESMDQGQTWGEPAELAPDGAGPVAPELAVSETWLAWTDTRGAVSVLNRPGNPLAPVPPGRRMMVGGPSSSLCLVPGPGSSAEMFVGSRDGQSGQHSLSRARLSEGEPGPLALQPAFEQGTGSSVLAPKLLQLGDSVLALVAVGSSDEERTLYWASRAAGDEAAWTPLAMLTSAPERVLSFDAVQHGARLVVAYEISQPEDPQRHRVQVRLLEPDGSSPAGPQRVLGADFAPVLAAGEGDCFLGAVARGAANRAIFRILRWDAGSGWGAFRELECRCGQAFGPGRFAMAVAGERLVVAHADAQRQLLVTSLLRDASGLGPH